MTYRGFWIVCHNCLFPIRMPYLLRTPSRSEGSSSISIQLACPVCAHVEHYNKMELKPIAFRVPDPFRQKKVALYIVEVPCRIAHCRGTARIHTVAATSISISSLLELWKYWVIPAQCASHSFKARRRWTWGVYGVDRIHWLSQPERGIAHTLR